MREAKLCLAPNTSKLKTSNVFRPGSQGSVSRKSQSGLWVMALGEESTDQATNLSVPVEPSEKDSLDLWIIMDHTRSQPWYL